MERRLFRLSQVTSRVDQLLRPAYGRQFWVRAEIGSGNLRGSNYFGELVEAEGGRVLARLRVHIWAAELARIRKKFEREGLAVELAAGTTVGLYCVLNFDSQYGLSLRGLDMDPAVALGELELRRRKVLERLTAAGLLDRNAALPVPRTPLSIALVTSRDSAACEDFLTTLGQSGFGFRTYLLDAAVQGAEADATMTRALKRAARLPVEVVIIVRGGGSKVELATLDSEVIARAIAAHPLPIWTGIGHETDTSVLDHVAGRSFKTPTAAAEELVRRGRATATLLDDATRRLATAWRQRRGDEQRVLRDSRTGLQQGTRKLLELCGARLRERARAVEGRARARLGAELTRLRGRRDHLAGNARQALRERDRSLAASGRELGRGAQRRIDLSRGELARTRRRLRREPLTARIAAERRTLAARAALLAAADPAAVLKRGYALLRDDAGQVVRSIVEAAAGARLRAELADGRLDVEVLRAAPRPGEEEER